ncbi:hypothetical protein [Aeromicrobium ginsengisoli]|uniref:DUF3558 domain-containing protein n=1 Tax=Aeromicrobium ginsengisoli TaxID=363867 RepID=A0A5M4FBA2_9ACTN|nr:hypothetical protein [Aeromicrobium ginsengisoli]KAA1395539.1 hypothetical protein ESP70_015400 [Aeromicrobium ginsengisoli]
MTLHPRLIHSLRTAAVVLVIGTGLAACDGGSDGPKPPIDSTLVDGKVCGLFDPDLVKSVIGHDEIKVRGTGIGDVTKRTDDTIDCDVVDDRRVASTIQVIVAEQPDASDHASTETMLTNELAGKTDCSQPASITELGPGYVCTREDGQVQLNVLLPKRLVRLSYQPGPDAKGDATATAVKLVKDVDANIDAYDKKHAG